MLPNTRLCLFRFLVLKMFFFFPRGFKGNKTAARHYYLTHAGAVRVSLAAVNFEKGLVSLQYSPKRRGLYLQSSEKISRCLPSLTSRTPNYCFAEG